MGGREPLPGEQASERTEVKLLRDTQNLYIGVVCHDSAPDRVIGTQMARDADLSADDRIEIVLDTFHDRHNAYYFATNPAGSLVDGLVIQNGNLNVQWDGLWLVRTRRGPFGWSAEFAIPYALAPQRPSFLGHAFQDEPEFGVYALHAWVWLENPNGMFEETNPRITCGA